MNYSTIETTLFSKRDFAVKACVSNVFKNYNAVRGYKSKRDNLIKLQYKPANSIVVGSRRNLTVNIMIPIEDFYEFVKCIKKLNKAIKIEDMYVLDKGDKLVLNKKLSLENQQSIISYGKSLIMRTDVVILNELEYEGIVIILNKNDVFYLTHTELKKMYKLLKNIDISTYMLVASIAGYQLKPDNLGDGEIVDESDDIEKHDYFKQNNDGNIDVLSNAKPKKRGGIWK